MFRKKDSETNLSHFAATVGCELWSQEPLTDTEGRSSSVYGSAGIMHCIGFDEKFNARLKP